MRLPLGEIEEARRDLGAYLHRKKAAEGGRGFYPKSKFQTLKRAIYCFHRRNGDLAAAHEYLEESFLRQFKQNPRQLAIYSKQLEDYAREFERSRASVFRFRDRLIVPLPQQLSSAGLSVTGEIPRVDMTDDGYTAWLFAKKPDRWNEELRLPIIQLAYAREMGAEEDEIKVGVYDFSNGEQRLHHFTESELEAAENELHHLLRRLGRMNKADDGLSFSVT